VSDFDLYIQQLTAILEQGNVQISNIKPSDWTEANMIMQKPFPGPFRYSKTPYTREIVDCLSPDHPARWVAVMKGAQVGFSSGVIYPGVGWIIKNNPGNTFITVGAPDLIEKSMEKLDLMIDACGIRDYIKPQVMRNRMNKSGDTNFKKEFPGGYVTIASANNHKAIRQVDLQYGFFDDFESVKGQSKESGDTRKLLEQRFAAYADTHKIFYISTPELKETSNIEPAYMLGDRRRYYVPCPCCGDMIELRWSITNGDITGGIHYKTDDDGRLIKGSVGYICQSCGGFFTDKSKHEMLNNGLWKPTAEPSKEGYYSYQISSLYAPIGMYDWEHYVNDYIEANPIGQPRIEKAYKAFVNLCLGEPYEPQSEQLSANSIQRNCRQEYVPCTIPEKLSMSDGNGRIVLITCAADMNGKIDDARLDYEIVAWSEKGASYSIEHGSIGTFIPRENTLKHKVDRERKTYEFGVANSVWGEFDRIVERVYMTDTGRRMQIARTGLDCGYFSNYAYSYIDSKPIFPVPKVMGLKGKGEEQFELFDKDLKYFVPAKERPNLYILTVGRFKDDLAEYMQLNWTPQMSEQPYGFMNFPQPTNGMYGFTNFFEHYESEHRVIEAGAEGKGVMAAWKKKGTTVMNHMWDCRVYNMAVREIMIEQLRKELKVPKLTWREFCLAITGGK
jgi:phage terminase large subunit GpA-like protein